MQQASSVHATRSKFDFGERMTENIGHITPSIACNTGISITVEIFSKPGESFDLGLE